MSQDSGRNPNLDIHSPSVTSGGAERWRSNLGRDAIRFPRDDTWWTGRDPRRADCPGRRPDGTVAALPIPNLAFATRDEVRAYFENGWALTEILFSGLVSEEAFFRPPYHGLRHPFIFYYTHPAALYINKLRVAGLVREPIDAYYETLFETGVDEMSWDDLSKNEMDWPSIGECRKYRRQVFELVSALIDGHPALADGHPPIGPASPLWALFLGFEHERIHIETSSVLVRELPIELVRRPAEFPPPDASARLVPEDSTPAWRPSAVGDLSPNPFVELPPGTAVIGKEPSFPSFGWDNEYGQREVRVEAFAASRHPITNAEFHAFVVDGGYREDRWWTDEGRRWRNYRNVKWPTYWVPSGPQGSHQYILRTVFERVEMPWNWPAVVNFHEAKAYAAWRSERDGHRVPLRLLTEAEHHRLRAVAGFALEGRLPSGDEARGLLRDPEINSGLRIGSESPVGRSRRAFGDVFGNVWQWCEDPFHPLGGFRIHPYYDDFSTPCFDGKHQMILGGSFVSAGDEATIHARFHFRPHFFQHAGFRLVDPLRAGNDGAVGRLPARAAREGDPARRWASVVHAAFAPREVLLPEGLAVSSIHREDILERVRRLQGSLKLGRARAIDVGCGPGALVHAIAPLYDEVVGVDLDGDVIAAARAFVESACVRVEGAAVGQDGDPALAFEVPLDRGTASRVSFRQADASSLPAEYLGFDLVLLSRIITSLPSPGACLGRLGGARGLVRPGGLLVLADAFLWEAELTPRELWFAPEPESIAKALGGEFELLEEGETFAVERPFAARTQLDRLRLSVWRRRT